MDIVESSNKSQHQCETCKSSFSNKYQLKIHIAAVHQKINVYSCEECNQKFEYNYELQTHISIKHERKEFECQICHRTFNDKRNLNRHFNTRHLKLKPYRCEHCGKSYGQSQDLNRHKKAVHLKQKSYGCIICKKKFAYQNDLARHIRNVHQKVKNLSCTFCDKRFTRSQEVKIHIFSHHNSNIKPKNSSEKPQEFKKPINKHMDFEKSKSHKPKKYWRQRYHRDLYRKYNIIKAKATAQAQRKTQSNQLKRTLSAYYTWRFTVAYRQYGSI